MGIQTNFIKSWRIKRTKKIRYYRIFYGTVHWHTADPGNIHKACVPFVQFGEEENFERARRNGDIREIYPCHILDQDLDEVMTAIKELREIYN